MAVSWQIQQLEVHGGGALVGRTSHHVGLSDRGRDVYGVAKVLLAGRP